MQKKKKKKLILKKKFVDVGPLPKVGDVSFKDTAQLKKFLSDRHKILPRKLTRVSASLQRAVSREIRKARIMGLLPFTERHEVR
ncbi:30S ribosomal protein S18 [Candidatus Parcubacteria bacterium]|nr:30S ribosomal protein S18 [Patescibacteria group bacterium]MBU4381304.1 30S ribosomal protein S18 [Patescibacteria group bacterium]MCG2689021.1 30S ribosomal protein S18 [Candidatus Parcubacteria bacterium]